MNCIDASVEKVWKIRAQVKNISADVTPTATIERLERIMCSVLPLGTVLAHVERQEPVQAQITSSGVQAEIGRICIMEQGYLRVAPPLLWISHMGDSFVESNKTWGIN